MVEHICTDDSLVAGGEEMNLKCFICEKDTKHKVSYGGMKCSVCGLYMFDFDDFTEAYRILRKGMQRKEVAQKLGLKVSTVSNYQSSPYGLHKLCSKLKQLKE